MRCSRSGNGGAGGKGKGPSAALHDGSRNPDSSKFNSSNLNSSARTLSSVSPHSRTSFRLMRSGKTGAGGNQSKHGADQLHRNSSRAQVLSLATETLKGGSRGATQFGDPAAAATAAATASSAARGGSGDEKEEAPPEKEDEEEDAVVLLRTVQ